MNFQYFACVRPRRARGHRFAERGRPAPARELESRPPRWIVVLRLRSYLIRNSQLCAILRTTVSSLRELTGRRRPGGGSFNPATASHATRLQDHGAKQYQAH